MMRDTSADETTGWIRGGNRFDVIEPYLAGLAEVRNVRIPAAGRRYLSEAMDDPEARPILARILAGSAINDRLAEQAEADIAEALKPTGKVIVFKNVVREILPRIRAVEAALANAMPGEGTWDSRTTSEIMAGSEDPKGDLEEHFFSVAENAVAWGAEAEGISGTVLGALGFSKKFKRRIRKLYKPALIAAAVIAAPFVLPAIASVVSTVGGAVVSGVSSLFGGSKAPPQTTTPVDFQQAFAPGPAQTGDTSKTREGTSTQQQAPAIDFNAIAGAAVTIWKLKQAGQTTQAGQSETQLLQYLMAQGMSQSQASALVAQAMMQAQRETAAQMPSITVSTSAPGGSAAIPDTAPSPVRAGMMPEIPWGTVALVGAGVLVASQLFGGGKRR